MLFLKKSSFVKESESDKSENVDSNEEYNAKLYSSTVMIMKQDENFQNKRFRGEKIFPIKYISSESKRYDVGKFKTDDEKWFSRGGTDHFTWDWKVKKNIHKDEFYETKYKHLVASMKIKNLEYKVLVAEEEE